MSHYNHPDLFPNLRPVKLESFAHGVDSDFNFRVKYVVHFEISDISNTDGYGEHDEQWIEVLEEPNGLTSALATTENAFKEVYKHNPKVNFIDEWLFITKLPKEVVEEYSWLLFSDRQFQIDLRYYRFLLFELRLV